jgi:lipid-binding SYLF domain-containing protein
MPDFNLEEEITRASGMVKSFTQPDDVGGVDVSADNLIPLALIQDAKGVAFITVLKIGFIQSVKIGTGLVMARLKDGSWSAPAAIGTGGLGWGLQFGGEMTEFMLLLNNDEAVEAFSGCVMSQNG